MNRKQMTGFEIKAADKGEVTAVFSTLNEVDADMDVTLSGAFKNGQEVVISAYGHGSWSGALPVGKGRISSSEKEAVLDGSFFMSTTHGRDTFATVKELADSGLGQWSYGYDVLEAAFGKHNDVDVRFLKSLDVFEVCPVLRGAGVDTRTESAKGLKFNEEGALLVAQLDAFLERANEVMVLRSAKGGELSPSSVGQIRSISEQAAKFAALLEAKAADPPSVPDVPVGDVVDLVHEDLRRIKNALRSA